MKKGLYQINIKGGYVDVTAFEFWVYGCGLVLVHRDFHRPNTWTVSEPRTGLSIVSSMPTRKQAMEAAVERLYNRCPTSEDFYKVVFANLVKVGTGGTKYNKETYGNERDPCSHMEYTEGV